MCRGGTTRRAPSSTVVSDRGLNVIHDIFEFWLRIGDGDTIHPDDRPVFARQGPGGHRFETDCLPIGFFGPLRTAPVVLLFLSPGYVAFDREHARTMEGQAYYKGQRDGRGRLPGSADHPWAAQWCTRILRQFDLTLETAADRVAVLNIGAYHSASFHDWHMLSALPSSRVALDFAQAHLFPAAEAGRRVVVCLRSARIWGLAPGHCFGRALFAPKVGQGGHMHKTAMRDEVRDAVHTALTRSSAGPAEAVDLFRGPDNPRS